MADLDAAYARAEDDRAARRAARRRLGRAGGESEAGLARDAVAAAEARLALSEPAAQAAFADQGGGPCAYTALGERLIDILADVAVAGFAAELAPARFLCNETFELRERGAVAEVLSTALELQCGARAARAARRARAEMPNGAEGGGATAFVDGTTQLMRAASRDELAPRVRALVALGAPLNLVDGIARTADPTRQPAHRPRPLDSPLP